jgi:hypothetical protein
MNISNVLVFTASLPFLTTLSCNNCPDIGCGPELEISFDDSKSLEDGEYDLQLGLEGSDESCLLTVNGEQASAACDGNMVVLAYPDSILVYTRATQIDFRLEGKDSGDVVAETLVPDYGKESGGGCPKGCAFAEVSVPVVAP